MHCFDSLWRRFLQLSKFWTQHSFGGGGGEGGAWLEEVSPAALPPNAAASDIVGVGPEVTAGERQRLFVTPRDVIGRPTPMPSNWSLLISNGSQPLSLFPRFQHLCFSENSTKYTTDTLSLGFGPSLLFFSVTRAGSYTVSLFFFPGESTVTFSGG